MAYDIVIKNGTVIDGTGSQQRHADVAIQGDRIAEIGTVTGAAKRTINAEGKLITPGFVDIHTHLDAQIWWDPAVSSSCWHGVTSVVMGNCGVTFAPCRPQDRDYLAHLMESVEDIPATSITEGMPWKWETYGEYLKALDTAPKGVNVGGMSVTARSAIGPWVKKAWKTTRQPRGHWQDARYCRRSHCRRGARIFYLADYSPPHPGGTAVPGTFAEFDELMGIASALGELQRGVVEAAPGIDSGRQEDLQREVHWMTEVSLATGRPVTFGLAQSRPHPTAYASMLDQINASANRGAKVFAQSTTRGIGVLFGLCQSDAV